MKLLLSTCLGALLLASPALARICRRGWIDCPRCEREIEHGIKRALVGWVAEHEFLFLSPDWGILRASGFRDGHSPLGRWGQAVPFRSSLRAPA